MLKEIRPQNFHENALNHEIIGYLDRDDPQICSMVTNYNHTFCLSS